jgi:hypothetical protein
LHLNMRASNGLQRSVEGLSHVAAVPRKKCLSVVLRWGAKTSARVPACAGMRRVGPQRHGARPREWRQAPTALSGLSAPPGLRNWELARSYAVVRACHRLRRSGVIGGACFFRWMKLLTAGGLSYKRARIVSGEISAIIYECRYGVLWQRLGTHERAALGRERRVEANPGARCSEVSCHGQTIGWEREAPARPAACRQCVLSPSGRTRPETTQHGGGSRERDGAKGQGRRSWSCLCCGACSSCCYCDWTNPFLAESSSWRTNPHPATAGCAETAVGGQGRHRGLH